MKLYIRLCSFPAGLEDLCEILENLGATLLPSEASSSLVVFVGLSFLVCFI